MGAVQGSVFGGGVRIDQKDNTEKSIFCNFMTKIMTFLDFRNSGREKSFFREIGGRASVLVPEMQ